MGFTYSFSDALEARNQGLFRLREVDDELRLLFPDECRYHDLMDEREGLCEALIEMECCPWPFDSSGDNSWLK